VLFAGIAAPEPKLTCEKEGKEWLCGVMAMTALRRLVRSRTIKCDVPVRDRGSAGSTTVRRCTLGNRDLSAWLVERG
jgi:endonuclease YncB( thermonuclease family)